MNDLFGYLFQDFSGTEIKLSDFSLLSFPFLKINVEVAFYKFCGALLTFENFSKDNNLSSLG